MVPLSLVHNLSLLVTLSLLSGFLMRWFRRRGVRYSLLLGFLFGAATLVGMATPVVHRPGIIFDGRSIVLGIAGLFGGPLVAAVAALMAIAFRIHLGGAGALMGVLVILESSLVGVGGHFLGRRWKGMMAPLPLLGLGLVIHLGMVALMAVLPGTLAGGVLGSLGPGILLAYPLGFMIAGLAFVELERHFLTEGALLESEERFRTIFEKGSDGMVMFSAEGEILEVNEAFARMRGYTRGELRRLRVQDLDTPETALRAPSRIARMLDGETLKVDLEQVHKNRHVFHVEATASRVFFRERPVILSFHRDITERKRAEEALRTSEAKLQMLLRSTAEGIYSVDLAGRCTFCNPACLRLLGYRAEEDLLGRNMHELVHHATLEGRPLPEDACRIFRSFREGMGSHADDEVLWRSDGTSFRVEYWSYPQRSGGKVVGAVVTFIDITERRRAEEERRTLEAQLHQAQKMESLGGLAGGIAHDMNNVLGAILGLASANVELQPPGSPARQAFEVIIKAAERGGGMVKGLLSFAHRTPAEERRLDLNELLREEVRLLERTTLAKVQIRLDLAEDLNPILGDAGSLTHAFMNLCINAVDAMPEGGTLALRTRNLGDRVEVALEDTGIGMPREVLDRALDPFFTTKEQGKGTGLGLSLVYSAAKAHKGRLSIRSEPGLGTCVTLDFPACEPLSVAEAGEDCPEAGARPGLRILVVDDDDLVLTSERMLLEVLGHTVTGATSGEEALARLESGWLPDLVVLDMNMPGLGGAGTLPRLRAAHPALPVLLATGRPDQAVLDLVQGDPATLLLPKPFSMGEVREGLDAALGRIRAAVPEVMAGKGDGPEGGQINYP